MQKSLLNKIKKWIEKNKVIDVILFGSAARAKMKPNDIDLCILIKDDDEKKSIALISSLAEITDKSDKKVQINILNSKAFLSGDSLAKTLLNEGYSIKNEKAFSEKLGYSNKSIFIYSLKKFSNSERVRFHYLLNGRYGAKGILKETEGEFLGAGVIIIPTKKEDALREVFDAWKVEYKIERILLG